ncbi:MAG: hypothetical protein JW838_00180 [Spirochaetes bacterium]|nr:hypothetical protein [Spirochaetota bacterium]
MMRLVSICFIACLVFSIPSGADDCTRYADGVSGYGICLPPGWTPVFTAGTARRLTARAAKGAVEISVSASSFGDREQRIWDGFPQFRTVEIGRRVMRIIETGEMKAAEEVHFKLLLFEYPGRKGRVLQRSLLVRYGERLLVVECRAPVGKFSRYSTAFNRTMASIEFSGSPRGESVERFAKADKAVDVTPVPEREKVPDRATIPERETVPDKGTAPHGGGTSVEPAGAEGKKVEIDPETMKIIEGELEKLQRLEDKGLIERVEGQ